MGVSTGNESPPPADGFETSQIGLVSAVFLPEAALGGILQYGNASFPHRMLSLVQVWTMLGPVGQLTHTTSHLPSFIPHPFFQADVAPQQYMCGYYFLGGHAD